MGTEYSEVERPSIEILKSLGYAYLSPEENVAAREGKNQVILRDVLIDAVQRINDVDLNTARAVYHDLL